METKANNHYWFVAVVTPNTEIKSEEKLGKLVGVWKNDNTIEGLDEVTTYVPTQNVLRVQPSTGRRVQVKKVLTPCYMFIKCTPSVRYRIACEAKFILHFLMDQATQTQTGKNNFARIPNVQMENFKRMVQEAEEAVVIDTSRVRVGDKVRIKYGRLAGLEGHVCKTPDGSTMLALRVDFLGYAKMQCPTDILELVKE